MARRQYRGGCALTSAKDCASGSNRLSSDLAVSKNVQRSWFPAHAHQARNSPIIIMDRLSRARPPCGGPRPASATRSYKRTAGYRPAVSGERREGRKDDGKTFAHGEHMCAGMRRLPHDILLFPSRLRFSAQANRYPRPRGAAREGPFRRYSIHRGGKRGTPAMTVTRREGVKRRRPAATTPPVPCAGRWPPPRCGPRLPVSGICG